MHGTLNDQSLIYLQIAQMIEGDILRQVYLAGEQVPSTNQLAQIFTINPATAAKGLNLLATQGILEKRRGLGMFVTQEARAMILVKRKEEFLTQFIKPMLQEAKALGLTQGDVLAMLTAAEKENL